MTDGKRAKVCRVEIQTIDGFIYGPLILWCDDDAQRVAEFLEQAAKEHLAATGDDVLRGRRVSR